MLMNLYYNTQKTDSKCNWVMDSLNKGWPLSRPMRDRQYHGGPSSFWGFIDANWYLIQELENFRIGARGVHPEDVWGAMMRGNAVALDDETVKNVVAYIQTLRAEP